jgi:hypothetical protein
MPRRAPFFLSAAATKSQRIGWNGGEQNVTNAPAAARKINNLEDVHCVRDAGVAGSNPATPTILSSTYSFDVFRAQ